MLFCRLPYDASFRDKHGDLYVKVSGLRRRNAIRVLSASGDRERKEAFFSASAEVTQVGEDAS